MKFSNFLIGDFVSKINIASKGHLKSINVPNTVIICEIINILYKNGIISGFTFYNDNSEILVFLKYYNNNPVNFNLKLISKPSKRIYWSLNKLSLNLNVSSFSSFYIISTSKGLMTSTDCLIQNHLSGEVLIKVTF